MGRSPCCEKEGLKKGPWTPEEDQKLLAYIEQHGHGCWRSLPSKAGELRRYSKLASSINCFLLALAALYCATDTIDLMCKRQEHTNHHAAPWSAIATHLPKRTDNEIKNYWNTHLKKRLAKMGIDPVTHKPRSDMAGAGGGGGGGAVGAAGAQHAKAAAHLSHTAQWESARLEAEARLAREAKLRALAASASSVPALPTLPGPAGHGLGLDSPTSTLSFSESAALASVLDAHGAAAAARAAMQPMQAYDEACKEQHWGNVDAADVVGFDGAGFTSMLLDGSLNQIPRQAASETEADGEFQETEEEKSYWNSILNLTIKLKIAIGPVRVLPPARYNGPREERRGEDKGEEALAHHRLPPLIRTGTSDTMLAVSVHPVATPAVASRARVTRTRVSASPCTTSTTSSSAPRLVHLSSTRRQPLRSLRGLAAAAAASGAVEAEESVVGEGEEEKQGGDGDANAGVEAEEYKVQVPERQDPMLVLKFIWMEKNIGIALDQLVPGYGSIPLSPYYFWPRKDAWEELRAKLEEKEWISQKQMIILLNQATDIINLWQQGGGSFSA
ncbi:hypothetical protein ABZP36_007884 [Zizania latifolia]